ALERTDRKKPGHKGAHPRKDGREARKDQKSSERPARGVEDAPAAPPHMVEDKPLVGSINVRQYEQVAVGGRLDWKIDKKDNEYVLAAAITLHHPSLFGGLRLGDETGLTAALGFVSPRWGAGQAYTTNTAQGGGVNRQLAARAPLAILETAVDKAGKPTV